MAAARLLEQEHFHDEDGLSSRDSIELPFYDGEDDNSPSFPKSGVIPDIGPFTGSQTASASSGGAGTSNNNNATTPVTPPSVMNAGVVVSSIPTTLTTSIPLTNRKIITKPTSRAGISKTGVSGVSGVGSAPPISRSLVYDLECKPCGLTFKSSATYETHWRTVHGNDRPYKCPMCANSFKRKHHLVEHARLHSGKRGFKCNVCGKEFKQRCTLTHHTRTHSMYSCPVCHKKFNGDMFLMKHMTVYNHLTPEMLAKVTDADGNLKLPLPASLQVPAAEMISAIEDGAVEDGEEVEEEEEEPALSSFAVDPLIANRVAARTSLQDDDDVVDPLLGGGGGLKGNSLIGGGGTGGAGGAGALLGSKWKGKTNNTVVLGRTGSGGSAMDDSSSSSPMMTASSSAPNSSLFASSPDDSFTDCISSLKAAFNFNGGLDNFNVQDFLTSAAAAAVAAGGPSDGGVAALLASAFGDVDPPHTSPSTDASSPSVSSSSASSSLSSSTSKASSSKPSTTSQLLTTSQFMTPSVASQLEDSPLFDDDILLGGDDELGGDEGGGGGEGVDRNALPNVTTELMPLEVTPLEAVLNRVADN